MNLNKMVDTVIEAVKHSEKKGTQPYDATAEVVRIEGDTAWVHINGGIDETPIKLTINAVEGDIVQIRVGGGSAWIVGNESKPPTDDAKANVANTNAIDAKRRANKASQSADKAQKTALSAIDIANRAQTSADGKNTIYYGATQPTGGTVGDTWFKSSEDNAIYTFNGTSWVKEELGNGAIADLSITNAKIADGTIQNAKIGNLDAGKITSGTIDTNRLNVGQIISTGGIAVVGDIPTDVSELVNDANYATTTQVATAKGEAISTASSDATSKANEAKKTATNYLTAITGTSGISVHDVNDASNYVNVTSNAVNVVTGGTNVAQFGTTARIGAVANNTSRTEIASSGIDFISRSSSGTDTTLAHIGYDVGTNQSGSTSTDKFPYYTFGLREGGSTVGNYSSASGYLVKASGYASMALGSSVFATGTCSFAEGSSNTASGNYSHAEGIGTTASGNYSHAEGSNTTASGNYSHAEGNYTIASGDNQFVNGTYNVSNANYAEITGWGASGSRKNIKALDTSGNLKLKGDVYVGCNDDSSGGTEVVSFADVTESGGTSNPYGKIPKVGSDGVMEVGKYLDFHDASGTGTDYNTRLVSNGGSLYLGSVADTNKLLKKSEVGATTYSAGSATTVATGTWVTVQSVSLSAGTYIFVGRASFPSNSSGRRGLRWSQSPTLSEVSIPPVTVSATTVIQSIAITQLTSTTTCNLQAFQSSGGNLSVTPAMQYIKII